MSTMLTEKSASVRPEQVLTEAEVKSLPPLIPVIVAYGMGWDSTALLVEFQKRGICPDLIMFADTGNELPETYAYLDVINAWLRKVGFPQVTVVSLPGGGRAKYDSLYESLWTTECLPSISFGMKTCSQRWKGGPQNRYCNNWYRTKECWEAGYKAIKVIGYDAGNRDTTRYCDTIEDFDKSDDAKKYILWCPLIEWGLSREMLPEIITSAGLPLPIKSACAFCGARKKPEILELAENHPDLAFEAVRLERRWKTGKHPQGSTKGLGRTFSWEDYLAENGYHYPTDEAEPQF